MDILKKIEMPASDLSELPDSQAYISSIVS